MREGKALSTMLCLCVAGATGKKREELGQESGCAIVGSQRRYFSYLPLCALISRVPGIPGLVNIVQVCRPHGCSIGSSKSLQRYSCLRLGRCIRQQGEQYFWQVAPPGFLAF